MGKSNIDLFKDGVRFFMIIIRICTFYSPLRVFLPVSFIMFMLGFSYYGYTLFHRRPFYEYECAFVYNLCSYIYDGTHFRPDLSDAF